MMNLRTSLFKIFLSFLFLLAAPVLSFPKPFPPNAPALQDGQHIVRRAEDAIPAYAPTGPIGADEPARVYICEHVNWEGKCELCEYTLGSGACVVLDGTASSIGPEPGLKCTFYKSGVCRDLSETGTDDSLDLHYPGNPNLLTTDKGNFNDAVKSFMCYKAE